MTAKRRKATKKTSRRTPARKANGQFKKRK